LPGSKAREAVARAVMRVRDGAPFGPSGKAIRVCSFFAREDDTLQGGISQGTLAIRAVGIMPGASRQRRPQEWRRTGYR